MGYKFSSEQKYKYTIYVFLIFLIGVILSSISFLFGRVYFMAGSIIGTGIIVGHLMRYIDDNSPSDPHGAWL